ncbi:MAG: hypothetical protein ACXWE8_02865 [Solirubrobacterales bacterium]
MEASDHAHPPPRRRPATGLPATGLMPLPRPPLAADAPGLRRLDLMVNTVFERLTAVDDAPARSGGAHAA